MGGGWWGWASRGETRRYSGAVIGIRLNHHPYVDNKKVTPLVQSLEVSCRSNALLPRNNEFCFLL